ncbi:MAG: CHAP domain-containing protein, partial [Lachnospiraceae bacterium]|nr:CHAP domain-containing protein [Lachnospiraceae bacterium]
MGKKLKKDFKERHKASLEREIFHSKTDTIPEESRLKHNDDYRGKIVHEKERFQDKVHKKTSKINDDDDPLGKDLDNDGIIDRYDNDFRDSDYFESTYDVDDNLHKKDEFIGSSSKNYKAQKSRYKRKIYTDSLYTRKKDDVLKENKPEDKKTGKDTASKKVHSSIYKEQKKKLKKDMVK